LGQKEGKLYLVELFVQGEGWKPFRPAEAHRGVVNSYDDAVRLGLYAILKRIEDSEDRKKYGSRAGDIVGVRITETSEGQPAPLPYEAKNIQWNDHKWKFFRRGNVLMLYKSWSWPD